MDDDTEKNELDREAIDRDIAAGAKAFAELLRNASLDWTHWSATILGLRGLRSLAYARAGSTNMRSQAYRDAISYLLTLRKYAIYDEIDKQTRSDCYKLMNRLEDVDRWYGTLSTADKLRWKHPTTITKHCPRQYLEGGMRRHNQPLPLTTVRRKPAVTVETERLKALVLMLIRRLARYEPDVLALLDTVISPADVPSDPLDDLIAPPEADDEVALDDGEPRPKTKKPIPAKS